jgi:predicted esterase
VSPPIEISPAFVHRYVPGDPAGGGLTLLLLHGTGGDENDLLPLGPLLARGAALLSPRGKVLEQGMPRFFRRLAEGVFDEADLIARTNELADFVVAARGAYGLAGGKLVAVGLSNGANIAGAMLLLRPGVLEGAVLFRPMVPLVPDSLPELSGTPVLVAAGRQDPLVPAREIERLVELLRRAGAAVETRWEDAGHGVGMGEVRAAREWLGRLAETGRGG